MRKLLALLLVLLLVALPLHANTDSFNYVAFNQKALPFLQSESDFLSALASKTPADFQTVYGIFPGVYDTDISKLDVQSMSQGMQGILACAKSVAGSSDAAKKFWDQLANAGGQTQQLDCQADATNNALLRGYALAQDSNMPVAQIASSNDPNFFNPVLSALIQTYNQNAVLSADALEARVDNTVLFAARLRPRLGESISIDFPRLLAHFSTDPATNPYILASQLSGQDRKGMHILACWVRSNAPLGSIASYVSQGQMPSDAFIQTLPCLRMGLIGGLNDLKANYVLGTLALMGRNPFLVDPQNSGVPYAGEAVRAKLADARKASKDAILAADDFVNNKVVAMENAMAQRPNFEGVTDLTAAQRYVLTVQLQKRFYTDNADRFKDVADLKWYAGVSQGCAVGVLQGAAMGKVLGFAQGASILLPGPYRTVAVWGLNAINGYFMFQSAQDAVHLIEEYPHIAENQELAVSACNLAVMAVDMGVHKSLHDSLDESSLEAANAKPDQNVKAQIDAVVASKTSGLTPVEGPRVQYEPPAKIEVQNLQTQIADATTPEAKAQILQQAQTAAQTNTPLPGETAPPSAYVVEKVQQRLAHESDVDLSQKPIEDYAAQLEKLQPDLDSQDPVVAAQAQTQKQDLILKTEEDVFKSVVDDPGAMAITRACNQCDRILVHGEPGAKTVSHSVLDHVEAVITKIEQPGTDSLFEPASGNALVETTSDAFRSLQKGLDDPRNVELFRNLVNPSDVVSNDPHISSILVENRKQAVEAIKPNLPESLKSLVDAAAHARTPEEFDSIRSQFDDLRAKIRNEPDQYPDWNDGAALLVMGVLDPRLSKLKDLDITGTERDLYLSARGCTDCTQRAYQAALDKLPPDSPEYKDLKSKIKTQTRAETNGYQSVHDLLSSPRALTTPKGQSMYSPDEMSFLFPNVKDVDTPLGTIPAADLRALYAKINTDAPGLVQTILASHPESTNLPAGYLASGQLQNVYIANFGPSNAPIEVAFKIGVSDPIQDALYKSNWYVEQSNKGYLPKFYRVERSGLASAVLLEPIAGRSGNKAITSLASNDPARLKLASSVAETDAALSLATAQPGSDGVLELEGNADDTLGNGIFSDKTGKFVIIDYDAAATVRLALPDYLTLQFIKRFNELGPDGFKQYVSDLKSHFQSAGYGPQFEDAYSKVQDTVSDSDKATAAFQNLYVALASEHGDKAVFTSLLIVGYTDSGHLDGLSTALK